MRLKQTYLLFCVLGFIVPFTQFVPWFMEHGVDLGLFISELFSTRIGAFFGLDVIVSAAVLIIFILFDHRKMAIAKPWLPILATLCVGVSLGLPMYLYMRQAKHLETSN